MRAAVLGLPRGGTTAVTGLLRILGFQLPPGKFDPVCYVSESRFLRGPAAQTSLQYLPDWTVWKDPQVGSYPQQAASRLQGYATVRVKRPLEDVQESEMRWNRRENPFAEKWTRSLDLKFPRPTVTLDYDYIYRFPRAALGFLARELGLNDPTGEQLDRAALFIGPEGYKCPFPDVCEQHR